MSAYCFTVNGQRTAANEGLWKFSFDKDTETLSYLAGLGSFPLPFSLDHAVQSDGKIVVSGYNTNAPYESRLYRVNSDLSGFDSSFSQYEITLIDTDLPESNPGFNNIKEDGSFIYAVGWTCGLCVYSVDGSGNLTLKDSDTAATATGVVVVGGYVVVSCSGQGVKSYSVDGSGNLTLVDTDDQGGYADDIWSDGTYVYVANRTRGIEVYSLDGSGNLVHLANQNDASIRYIFGDDNFLYAGTGDGVHTILVYEYSGSTLTLKKTNDLGGYYGARKMWSDGTYLYVGRSVDGLFSYSIAGDGTLTQVDAFVRSGFEAHGVYGDGSFLYVCAEQFEGASHAWSGPALFTSDSNGKLYFQYRWTDVSSQGPVAIYFNGTFLFVGYSDIGFRSFSVSKTVGHYQIGKAHKAVPSYGVAVDPSDNIIWLAHYENSAEDEVSKVQADGSFLIGTIDNPYSTIAWDVVFDSDFDAPIVGYTSDSASGALAARYNKNTGAFIEGYDTADAICRSVYVSYPYVYLIREGIYAVKKVQTGVGTIWTSPTLTNDVMREVFKVGNYVIAAGAPNASSESVWLLDDSDGSKLDAYQTGGEARGGFPIDDTYFVIVGEYATNEDAETVNVSVFKIASDTIQYVTGYTIGDSSEVMINACGIGMPPTIDSQSGGGQSVYTDQAPSPLSVTASGDPVPTYQWYADGSPIAGATSSSYSPPAQESPVSISYTCVVTNPAGSDTSDPMVITWTEPPPPPPPDPIRYNIMNLQLDIVSRG